MGRFFGNWLPIIAMMGVVGPMLFNGDKRLAPVKVRVVKEERDLQ